ncbi:spindle and centriole-associated protein 1 isoform X1 [Octopus bimaculoides]|uniref:Spindle and centriole-associated protein 1 n=2 Tax=Octopus bimaculoides TaxID=37653 RepID=A0A0L8HSB4_OCTBM|nr:spindle and centriole-associated protein 1 isoform X1 [Octopus bimaculoides]|eukprot:XP_014769834.1 PREDICTED: spindle and centriole-associated protein 1-like isoform X2 [Octopus bimaculoides]
MEENQKKLSKKKKTKTKMMSFIKKGRPLYPTKNINKKRKKRPAWDDTMTDLSVYKSNPEELMYRKKIHQSKHLPCVKFQNDRKKNGKDEISLNLAKLNSRQLAIMKEVLYDQDQIKTVLEYSDRMMDRVADLCGDHPKRYQAFPSVTVAPNSEPGAIHKISLPKEVPEFHSHLDTLSSSLMDVSALNDDCHKQELTSASTESLPSVTYTSHSDMERFRKLLETEEKNLLAAQYSLQDQSSSQMNNILKQNPPDVPGAFTPVQNNRGPNTAVNDTTKVNKVRRVLHADISDEEPTSDRNGEISHSESGFTLKDLKKVLEEMQREMVIYEENTGKVPAEKQQKETFSGYTMSLCQTVIKLCRYLRETDEKLQEQTKLREKLSLETSELKLLIDALTLNLIESQDKYNSLYADMKEYQRNTNEEIASLKTKINLLTSPGMNGTILKQIQQQRSSSEVEQQQQHQQQQNYSLSSLLHQQLSSQTHQQLPSQTHQHLPSQTHQQLPSQTHQQLPSPTHHLLPSQNNHQLSSQIHAQLHTHVQKLQQQSSTQTHQQPKQTTVQVELQQQKHQSTVQLQHQQQKQELAHLACSFHSFLDDSRKRLFGSATEEENTNGWHDSSAVYESHQGNTLSSFKAAFQLSPPVQKTHVSSNSKDPLEFLDEAELSASQSIFDLTQQPALNTSIISDKHVTETILPGQIPEVYPFQNDTTVNSFKSINSANVPVSQSVLPETHKDIPARDNCLSPEIESKSFLASQIEELNKQHEEAERLLQKFLQSGKEQEEMLKLGGEFERQSQTEFQRAQGTDDVLTLPTSNQISDEEHPQTLEQQRSNSPHIFNGVSPAISPIIVEECLDQAV